MPGKHWTPDEEVYLVENWGRVSYQSIAEHLGKNPKSLHGKAMRLGLVKTYLKPSRRKEKTVTEPKPKPIKVPKPVRTLVEAREIMKRKPGRIVALCGWRGLSR